MKKKYFIIIIILIFVIGGISIFNINKKNKDLTVFFLKTDEDKYLLYDIEGKKISDTLYDNTLDYIIDSTLVYKDDKVFIIDKKGSHLVKEDTYDDIVRYQSFYKALREEKSYLLDNKGNIIKDISNSKILSFKGAPNYIIVENDNSYEIILYNGKIIYTFERIDDVLPTVNQLDNLSSIFYNDTTIIFDNDIGNIIKKIESSIHYCIKEKDEDTILLNSCTTNYQDKVDYKIINKEKLVDIIDLCDVVSLKGSNILCEKNNNKYILDDNYQYDLNVTNLVGYINSNNYIKEVDNKIEFYKNGSIINTLANATIKNIGYQSGNYYILSINDLYYYYDTSGKILIDKGFDEAYNFDNNSLSLVKKNDKEYLIDYDGNRICDEVDSITVYSDFYIIDNSLLGLLDRKGNKILDTIYDNINIISEMDHNYAILNKKEEYILFDIDNKKEIASYNGMIETFNHYYKVDNKYYTYNGKEIYVSNKKTDE